MDIWIFFLSYRYSHKTGKYHFMWIYPSEGGGGEEGGGEEGEGVLIQI